MKPILISNRYGRLVLTSAYTATELGSLKDQLSIDYVWGTDVDRVYLKLTMDSFMVQLAGFPNLIVDLRPYCVQA